MTRDDHTDTSHPDTSSAQQPPHPLGRRSAVWLLVVTLLLIQFAYPIADPGGWWEGVYLLLYGGLVVFSVRAAITHPRRYWTLALSSALFIGGATWFVASGDDTAGLVAMLIGSGLLQLALMVVLIRALMDPPPRANGVDLLLVGVSGFLLIGGVFGAAAALMEIGSPGSFADPNIPLTPLPWESLLYGSFVTLSALGFGDVTPVSTWARSLFSLEGVIGVLFVAIVISQLVSVAGKALDSEE